MSPRLESVRFPYLPIRVRVGRQLADVEALLDTGFDGDVAVPPDFIPSDQPPLTYVRGGLADGSEVSVPLYRGSVQLTGLGAFPVLVVALGGEPLVGRRLTNRFNVILDHGQRVIVEP